MLDVLIHLENDSVDVEQIRSWFCREKLLKGIVKCQYCLARNLIHFSTLGHFGDGRLIEYSGIVKKDCLILDSLNHNNGRRFSQLKFVRC